MSVTLRAIEATIGPDGRIHTAEPLSFERPTKVILTVAVESDDINLAAASETVWARDWNNPDEDEAWADLQRVK